MKQYFTSLDSLKSTYPDYLSHTPNNESKVKVYEGRSYVKIGKVVDEQHKTLSLYVLKQETGANSLSSLSQHPVEQVLSSPPKDDLDIDLNGLTILQLFDQLKKTQKNRKEIEDEYKELDKIENSANIKDSISNKIAQHSILEKNIFAKIYDRLFQKHLPHLKNLEVANSDFLVITSASIAMGKTTVCTQLEEELGGIRFNGDLVRKILKENIKESQDIRMNEVKPIVGSYRDFFIEKIKTISPNHLFIIDQNMNSQENFEKYSKLFPKVYAIRLLASTKLVEERFINRSQARNKARGAGEDAPVSFRKLNESRKKHEHFVQDRTFDYTLDNEKNDPTLPSDLIPSIRDAIKQTSTSSIA